MRQLLELSDAFARVGYSAVSMQDAFAAMSESLSVMERGAPRKVVRRAISLGGLAKE